MNDNIPKVTPPRALILRDLRKGIVEFKFKKANGDMREMRATLVNRVMPENKIPTSDYNSSLLRENVDVIRCFDVDIKDWRSFRVDSLESYNGIVEAL